MQRIPFVKLAFCNLVAVVITTMLVAAAAFAKVQPQPLSAFDQQMLTVENQFIQALRDKNVSYAEQTVASDFQGVALNGDSFERHELIDDARDGMGKDVRLYEFQVVRLGDNCAVVGYSEIVPGDHPRYRHITDTWALEGGAWKLKFQHRTPRVWSAMDLD